MAIDLMNQHCDKWVGALQESGKANPELVDFFLREISEPRVGALLHWFEKWLALRRDLPGDCGLLRLPEDTDKEKEIMVSAANLLKNRGSAYKLPFKQYQELSSLPLW